MGDWGIANLHSACGWIAAGLRSRSAPGSTFVVHTTGGMRESARALIDGIVDLAIITPLAQAAMLVQGSGIYDEPHPELCAAGVLPHRDRLVLAIAADVADRLGIASYRDIAAKHPELRLVAAPRGGDAAYAAEQILERYGMDYDDLERWGGKWVAVARPPLMPGFVLRDEADGLFTERVMRLHELCLARPMRFLAIDEAVLEDLRLSCGFTSASLEPGELPGLEHQVRTLEWGNWAVMVRRDMPDDLAGLIARVMVEDREIFESKYTHLPIERSPLHYPITPAKLSASGAVPLHPAAAEYFKSQGAVV